MNSPTPRPDPESVLARLQPREHEPDAALDYEITRELIGQVLALYSARRAELEQTDPSIAARSTSTWISTTPASPLPPLANEDEFRFRRTERCGRNVRTISNGTGACRRQGWTVSPSFAVGLAVISR
jgi:hypothetical protein